MAPLEAGVPQDAHLQVPERDHQAFARRVGQRDDADRAAVIRGLQLFQDRLAEAVADGIRAEAARINTEVPGVRLSILNDSSVFISRSIASVKEAAPDSNIKTGKVVKGVIVRMRM